MPGKSDYGNLSASAQGQYYPGSKEFRAWDEGWRARYAQAAKNTNPQPSGTAKHAAWDAGWDSANANSAGTKRMPHVAGTPQALP